MVDLASTKNVGMAVTACNLTLKTDRYENLSWDPDTLSYEPWLPWLGVSTHAY